MSDGLPRLEARLARDLGYLNYPPPNWVQPRRHPAVDRVHDVVIIGAGMCGLVAAFALRREGVANVQVVDRSAPGFEGPWITYARMRTLRSPKHLAGPAMGLPALTFRAWYEAQHGREAWERLGRIPREMWMDYLRWYRKVLDLPVENRVEVRAISPDGELLRLDVARDGALGTMMARKVVLATGREGLGGPRIPDVVVGLPAERYAHTADDIDFDALRGRRVAVLGGGASACDNAAVALETGAAAVHLFVRRGDLPRVNKSKGTVYAGFVSGFPRLDDAWRWRILRYIVVESQVPPPRDSMLRLRDQPNFRLHLGSPWRRAALAGDEIEIETPKGRVRVDFVILGTGFGVDVRMRPELAGFAGQIALWRDRYVPPPELASDEFGRFPYLGPAFEFTEKQPGAAPFLRNLHCFNYAATLSHGMVSGDIPSISAGAQRLVDGIVQDLFVADRELQFRALQAYDDPELLGDEWREAEEGATPSPSLPHQGGGG